MTKKVEETQRVKKEYAQRGTRSQVMFNFRMDAELYEEVSKQANKGRFVNEAIRACINKE